MLLAAAFERSDGGGRKWGKIMRAEAGKNIMTVWSDGYENRMVVRRRAVRDREAAKGFAGAGGGGGGGSWLKSIGWGRGAFYCARSAGPRGGEGKCTVPGGGRGQMHNSAGRRRARTHDKDKTDYEESCVMGGGDALVASIATALVSITTAGR